MVLPPRSPPPGFGLSRRATTFMSSEPIAIEREVRVTEAGQLWLGHVEIPGFVEAYNDILPNAKWGNTPLVPWFSSVAGNATLEVQLGSGSGQRRSPFSCSKELFDDLLDQFDFSYEILRRVKEKQSYFEHVFSGGEQPTCLEIAASTYEHDAFFFLLRSDLLTGRTQCLLFFKTFDRLKTSTLKLSTVANYLHSHEGLQAQPLGIFNVILSLLQARSHDFLRWRQQLYDIEARIGVSANLSVLRLSNYSPIEYDYGKLNADLTGVARNIADNELSVSTMLEHASSFLRVADVCERVRRTATVATTASAISANSTTPVAAAGAPVTSYGDLSFSILHEEIQSTITRAEMYLKHTKMTQDVLASLTAALYNRINKSDTRSMKTIAVVTLFFLPSLFVAAIFSTGIFNFQAGESPEEERVISRYGWVYLLVTLLLTGLTLIVWTVWFAWGEMWLDTLRESRNKLKRTKSTSGVAGNGNSAV